MIHTDDQNAKGTEDFTVKVNSPYLLFPSASRFLLQLLISVS